jgi:magnesium transporter
MNGSDGATATQAPQRTATSDDQMRSEVEALLPAVVERAPKAAAKMLVNYPDQFVVDMLLLLNPAQAQRVLNRLPSTKRQHVFAAAEPPVRQQWMLNDQYPDNSVGHMMEPALAVFRPETTVGAATEELRQLVTRAFITYVFVVDAEERLVGVVAMREMLLAAPEQTLAQIMIPNPFRLTPHMELVEAMRATMLRHFPVYPVCDSDGKLIGTVRGQMLFEARTVELSLQAGTMMAVEKEERLSTPLQKSFRFRHPWLQANVFLAFIGASVVGVFQDTIDRVVALAVFLPVIISQSSNTGMQTLAVALRGLTLGELKSGREKWLVSKETLLGFANGAFTGITAGLAMYIFGLTQQSPEAFRLGVVVFAAMTASCLVTGLLGAAIPLVLRKIGTDPATASGIVLCTISDVCTLAVFLGLATLLV